jgi:hypothetical protein
MVDRGLIKELGNSEGEKFSPFLGVTIRRGLVWTMRGNWRWMPDNRGRTLVMVPGLPPSDASSDCTPDVRVTEAPITDQKSALPASYGLRDASSRAGSYGTESLLGGLPWSSGLPINDAPGRR